MDRILEIWKFKLCLMGQQEFEVPHNAQYLSVIPQLDCPTLYFSVNPREGLRDRYTLFLRGTGHPVAEEITKSIPFIGTIVTHGVLVWHMWLQNNSK